MRVLITNITLASHSGTETATRDLAIGLQSAGHQPMVYCPQLGSLADEIMNAGIVVVDDLERLPISPDIIHGHHHIETMQALQYFPTVPGIFVCHDRLIWHDIPPRHPRVRYFVGVDANCLERLTLEHGIPVAQTRVIHNSIDLQRFRPRPPLPTQPQRALIFSNYAKTGTHLEIIQEACQRLGLTLDVAGSGVGNLVTHPEEILGQYDLVFGKARCALEAMAVGTAVVLCDTRGLGGMVSRQNVENLREWNFGMRVLSQPLDVELVVNAIRQYQADDAAQVSAYIRESNSLSNAIQLYLKLYQEVLDNPLPTLSPLQEYSTYITANLDYTSSLEQEYRQWRNNQHLPSHITAHTDKQFYQREVERLFHEKSQMHQQLLDTQDSLSQQITQHQTLEAKYQLLEQQYGTSLHQLELLDEQTGYWQKIEAENQELRQVREQLTQQLEQSNQQAGYWQKVEEENHELRQAHEQLTRQYTDLDHQLKVIQRAKVTRYLAQPLWRVGGLIRQIHSLVDPQQWKPRPRTQLTIFPESEALRNNKAVFIVGVPRSGTSLMRALIGSHPNIALSPDELHWWTQLYPAFPNPNQWQSFLDKLLAWTNTRHLEPTLQVDNLREATATLPVGDFAGVFALIMDAYSQALKKPRWGEKTPLTEFFADEILTAYPNAQIIHMVRDPRANCASRRHFKPFGRLPEARYISLGWVMMNWRKSLAIAKRYQKQFPQRYCTVQYETLVADPTTTLKQVCEFLGEPYDEHMLEMTDFAGFQANGGNSAFEQHQGISQSPIKRYYEVLSPAEIRMAQWLGAREMKRRGYTTDSMKFSGQDWRELFFKVLPTNLYYCLWWVVEGYRTHIPH